MDVSQYMPMFLAEAREHLQELNLAVVRIEEQPNDRDTVDVIFRMAHSLKGMSATMGFDEVAALTHEMENVFELLRERRGGLDHEAITILLSCLDALEGALESIATDGEERLDSTALVQRLQGLVRGPAANGDAATADAAVPPLQHVRVELAGRTPMPAVRAYQVLTAVAGHGAIARSTPPEDDLDGFAGKTIDIWIASDHEPAALRATALAVADVESATVIERSETAPPAAGHKTAAATTVRVDAERLDQLMHLMGELVVNRTQVESLAGLGDPEALQHAMKDLTRSSHALQAMVMQVRMIPVEAVFLRFPRLVRDLSSKLGKQVELVLAGQDTELDRSIVESLGDPIVHLVRNSLDHGIEPPADRRAAGKPELARLEISARHAGGNVVISVRDDGRGIDPAHVAAKAVAAGLIAPEEAAAVDMAQAIELLFHAGFTTADETSDISGRGVGMDAVRSPIRELGGEVLLQSELGVGTLAEIRIPLTLAIMSALLVEAGGMPFAIQLDRVERTLALEAQTVRSVLGDRVLVLADGVLPLIDLAAALRYPPAERAGFAVIVRSGERRLALAVERLVGQRELVTRPLPVELGDRAALTGGAVLSNGEIALIVDCDAVGAPPARTLHSTLLLAA